MKLGEIAKILNGRLNGNPDIDITGVAEIKRAVSGDITFVSKKGYLPELKHSKASAVILQEGLDGEDLRGKSSVIVKNPYLSLISVLKLFYPPTDNSKGISPQSLIKTKNIGRDVTIYPFVCIEDDVEIGGGVVIYPFTYIGRGSSIAEGSIVYSNVSIYHNVIIGKNVIIHSGAVIGSDGFGFVRGDNGVYQKIPQVGNVIIEDDVEIGANVCIDRATLGSTVIKKGVKIDNLVQVAHNVTIGDNTVIAGQTGISGSCNIGKNVVMGGQVGLADHINIGDRVILGGKAGVTGDIDAGVYSGSPAIAHNEWKRIQAGLTKLPELIKKVRELERIVGSKK
jgi:UDP-3-O-[3-hydroxymyristoyl] glucosamine N-acyltransferase